MSHHPENIARAQRIIDACAASPDDHYYAVLIEDLRNPKNTIGDTEEEFFQIAVSLLTDLRHLCHIHLPEGKFEDALALSERHAIAEIDSPE